LSGGEEKIAWIREIYTDTYGLILAACDKELLGKKLRRGNVVIDVSPKFYGGRLVDREELIILMRKADVLNLMGQKVVSLAEEIGLIHPQAKIFFENDEGEKVPHAQMYRFEIL